MLFLSTCLLCEWWSLMLSLAGMFISPESSGLQWFNPAASSDCNSEFHLVGMVMSYNNCRISHEITNNDPTKFVSIVFLCSTADGIGCLQQHDLGHTSAKNLLQEVTHSVVTSMRQAYSGRHSSCWSTWPGWDNASKHNVCFCLPFIPSHTQNISHPCLRFNA